MKPTKSNTDEPFLILIINIGFNGFSKQFSNRSEHRLNLAFVRFKIFLTNPQNLENCTNVHACRIFKPACGPLFLWQTCLQIFNILRSIFYRKSFCISVLFSRWQVLKIFRRQVFEIFRRQVLKIFHWKGFN